MTRFLSGLPAWLYPLVILAPSIAAVAWYVVVWVRRGRVPTVVRVAAWVGWPLIGWLLTQYAFAKMPPVESNPPLFSQWDVYLWMGLALMVLAIPCGLADLVVFVVDRYRAWRHSDGRPDRVHAV